MSKKKMFVRMITASLVRRKSRMIVALLAIAIGATILSGLVTIYNDVPKQMGAQFRNYGANMIFTSSEGGFSPEEFQEALNILPGDSLVGATPYRYETVRIHEQPIQVAGTDMTGLQKTSPYWSVEGEWPSQSGQILLGEQVAKDLSISIGETTTLTYRPEDEDALDETFDAVVTGIVNTGGKEESYAYISYEDLSLLTGADDTYDLAEISVSASADELQSYVDQIKNGTTAITPSLVKRVTASEATVLSKLQALVLLVTVIVLALTMICVATTMAAVVSERRREIGLRKAIGASDASLIAEFMGEGMLLGAVGGLFGSFLGFAFAQFVSVNVFSSQISLQPLLIPVTVAVSIIVTGAACLIPIRSATKVDPALVLKGE
ncbi:MAG: ABC transporter permease [Lachnospiraceae bacterium]|nr:ABC transporter permease [Lachnospiraceae bacterium]